MVDVGVLFPGANSFLTMQAGLGAMRLDTFAFAGMPGPGASNFVATNPAFQFRALQGGTFHAPISAQSSAVGDGSGSGAGSAGGTGGADGLGPRPSRWHPFARKEYDRRQTDRLAAEESARKELEEKRILADLRQTWGQLQDEIFPATGRVLQFRRGRDHITGAEDKGTYREKIYDLAKVLRGIQSKTEALDGLDKSDLQAVIAAMRLAKGQIEGVLKIIDQANDAAKDGEKYWPELAPLVADPSSIPFGSLEDRAVVIESLSYTWMDFNDPARLARFTAAVEAAPEFAPLRAAVKGYFNVRDEAQTAAIRAATADLAELDRYIALTYIGAVFGFGSAEDAGSERPHYSVSSASSGRVEFHGGFHCWNNKESVGVMADVRSIVDAFNLEKRFTYWDGARALQRPGNDKPGCWVSEDSLGFTRIVDQWLHAKGLIAADPNKLKHALVGMLKAERGLAGVFAEKGLSLSQVEKFFGPVEPYVDTEVAGKIASYLKRDFAIHGDALVILGDGHYEHPTRGWDITLHQSDVTLISGGSVWYLRLPAHFIYEDIPDGRDIYHKENKVEEILGVERKGDAWIVTAKNKPGKTVSLEVRDFEPISLESRMRPLVQRAIEENRAKWLSHGNTNNTVLATPKGSTNYPWEIVHATTRLGTYIAVVKVIDARRVDDGVNESVHVARLSEVEVQLHRVSPETGRTEEVALWRTPEPMDNDAIDVPVVLYADGTRDSETKFAGVDPKILVDGDSVGVSFRTVKGPHWEPSGQLVFDYDTVVFKKKVK